MSTVVTRVVKGSPLTYAEMDANFNNLNTDKLQSPLAANLAAGSNKLTGLAAGTSNGDSVRFEQLPSATNLLPVASGGTGSANVSDAQTALGISTYVKTLLDDADAATAKGTLEVENGSIGLAASLASDQITISASKMTVKFRSETLTTGSLTTITGTPSNLVLLDTDSFGLVFEDGTQRIAILALNNAGTIELAACVLKGGIDLTETGVITTVTATTTTSQIKSTTARTGKAYRLIGFVDAAYSDGTTAWTSIGRVQEAIGQIVFPSVSQIRVSTCNGNGSTNTAIRRFTTVQTSKGSDVTYTDSASAGASFAINVSGVYSISYSDSFGAAAYLGLSLNSSTLTTAVTSLTAAELLTLSGTSGLNSVECISWTGYLQAGDTIRPHTNVTPGNGVYTTGTQFTITRVC